jgi:cytochrome c biogenesis protein CcdA
VLALTALVVSIALVDSANPATLAPALWFALETRARQTIAAFAAGVFLVSAVGGVVFVLGPGRALVNVVPRPSPRTVDRLTLGAGVIALVLAAALWLMRERVAKRLSRRQPAAGRRRPLVLGAAIMALDLPTAIPYFAALAAIVISPYGLATQLVLVAVYNAVFVAPLAALVLLVALAGKRGAEIAAQARSLLDRHGAQVLPALIAVAGVVLVGIGAADPR